MPSNRATWEDVQRGLQTQKHLSELQELSNDLERERMLQQQNIMSAQAPSNSFADIQEKLGGLAAKHGIRKLAPVDLPTWEEIQRSGQMPRGDMPRENYAPPLGQGLPYDNTTNPPVVAPKKPTWRHMDGTIATDEEVEGFFGKDLKRNPNVPSNQQGIDWDRIRKTPLRRRKEDLFDELDKRTRGTDKYEGTHPIYRGEKQELSNPIYKGEPSVPEYATKPNRQQQWELLRSLMGR